MGKGSVVPSPEGDARRWFVVVQSALRTTTNQCLASPSGEGTTLPFPIPYPQQSQISLPLDPLDESSGKEI